MITFGKWNDNKHLKVIAPYNKVFTHPWLYIFVWLSLTKYIHKVGYHLLETTVLLWYLWKYYFTISVLLNLVRTCYNHLTQSLTKQWSAVPTLARKLDQRPNSSMKGGSVYIFLCNRRFAQYAHCFFNFL